MATELRKWLEAEIAYYESIKLTEFGAGALAATKAALREVLSRLDAEPPGGWRPTHRHKKRGSEYELVGIAEAQVTAFVGGRSVPGARILAEGDPIAVYRAHDGKLWCRFKDEFEDGRFEVLAAAPPPPAAQEPAVTSRDTPYRQWDERGRYD